MNRKKKLTTPKSLSIETETLSLKAGELLRFASAMIVASGAAYLLGYLGQIDTYLFSYLSAADFLNAAIVYLPVSIVLATINGLQFFFKENAAYPSSLFERHWKTDDGRWGKKTSFRMRAAAFFAVMLLASVLALPLRFNFDLSPLAGIGGTLFFLALVNEIYRYGSARYGWEIQNFPILLSALYFLLTSIFIGALHVQVHENSLNYRSVLIMENGRNVCATAHKKLGSRLLFYDVERSDWQTVKLSKIEKTYALTDLEFVLNQSCASLVATLDQRKVTSFILTRPIHEDELTARQDAN
jgi:hypothetical protein